MTDQPPSAKEKHSVWPGWIWSVPIAALMIVAYLAFQQLAQSGPTVRVIFPTGGNITANNTKVKFQGIVVGEVEQVTLEKDLRHMDTVLRLHADMAGHLGKGTRFWIAGNQPSITNLASLKSVISGPYIGIEPHPGDKQDHYDGLGQKPVTAYNLKVTHYTLETEKLGTIQRDSLVYYHDLEVGHVSDVRLEDDRQHFRIDVFIQAPYDALVRDGTRFWDASAVQLSMAGAGPKLQMQSLPSLFQGAVAFDTPAGHPAGPAAKAGTSFILYPSRARAESAPSTNAVRYRVVFDADGAGGLAVGAPVTLDAKRIGSVTASQLRYDPASGRLQVVAELALNPHRIELAGDTGWAADPRPQLNAMLNALIGQGLRAQLGSTIPLVGGKAVELAFVASPGDVALGDGPVPEIPAGAQSGISGTLAAINGVAQKLQSLPLDQIGQSISQAAQHVAAITGSPELARSLRHLDTTLANIQQITGQAKGQVQPILADLHKAAREADGVVADVRRLVSSNPLARSQPGSGDLAETLYEVTRAARSLRQLADYMDRHPEALLHGREGG